MAGAQGCSARRHLGTKVIGPFDALGEERKPVAHAAMPVEVCVREEEALLALANVCVGPPVEDVDQVLQSPEEGGPEPAHEDIDLRAQGGMGGALRRRVATSQPESSVGIVGCV